MRILFLCFVFGLIIPPVYAQAYLEHESSAETLALQSKLSGWLKYYHLNLNDFQYEKTAFNLEGLPSVEFKHSDVNQRAHLVQLRDYSPNKRYFIPLVEDVISYNGERQHYEEMRDDSQTLWLYDTKKQKAYQLGFFGLTAIAEAVIWLNDQNVVVLSSAIEAESSLQYRIELFDFKKQQYRVYSFDRLRQEEESYFYENLRLKGIVLQQ